AVHEQFGYNFSRHLNVSGGLVSGSGSGGGTASGFAQFYDTFDGTDLYGRDDGHWGEYDAGTYLEGDDWYHFNRNWSQVFGSGGPSSPQSGTNNAGGQLMTGYYWCNTYDDNQQ